MNFSKESKPWWMNGGINITKLPSIKNRPELKFGHIADMSQFPVLRNTTTIIRWMFENFMSGKDTMHQILVNKATRVAPFLFETTYDRYDWNDLNLYYKHYIPDFGGCSSIAKGGFLARNYDWYDDREASIIVRVPANADGRHASIGMSGCMSAITDDLISKGKWDDTFKLIPFNMLDGINDCGVCLSCNVVPAKENPQSRWHGTEIMACAAIRYCLDNCTTAEEAADAIVNKVYMMKGFKYEFHWLINDGTKMFLVENGEKHDVTNDRSFMTNFESTGDIMTEGALDYDKVMNFDPYGSGLERYTLIVDQFEGLNSTAAFKSLLKDLRFTNAYDRATTPFWTTEACGKFTLEGTEYDLSVVTARDNPEKFEPVLEFMIRDREEKKGKERGTNPVWPWQTVHSSIYDIANRTLLVSVHESDSYKKIVLDPYAETTGGGSGDYEDVKRKVEAAGAVAPIASHESTDIPDDVDQSMIYATVEDIRKSLAGQANA